MDIIIQVNNSEDNKIGKSLTTVATLTGTLKSETSIIDPIITIEASIDTLKGCNYMTIPNFGRSYFIRNIKAVTNSLIEVTCHVDVLQSFAPQILACTGIIRRQENNWNLYLNDGSLKVYQNPIVLTKAFPSGFTTQELVLAVAGG